MVHGVNNAYVACCVPCASASKEVLSAQGVSRENEGLELSSQGGGTTPVSERGSRATERAAERRANSTLRRAFERCAAYSFPQHITSRLVLLIHHGRTCADVPNTSTKCARPMCGAIMRQSGRHKGETGTIRIRSLSRPIPGIRELQCKAMAPSGVARGRDTIAGGGGGGATGEEAQVRFGRDRLFPLGRARARI